jgi:hypothetical protein
MRTWLGQERYIYEAEFLELTKWKLNHGRQRRNAEFSAEENTSEKNWNMELQ